MLQFLKQKLDHYAIEAAARSLPPGRHDPARVRAAAALLASGQFWQVPDVSASVTDSRIDSPARAFQFPSTLPLGLPRNDLVHGRLFRAGPAWSSRPLVLLVHGWNAELHYLHVLPQVARALNRRGLNAAMIELPLHLQRRPPKNFAGPRDFISDDLATMLRATAQALADFHAYARWALAQGCPNVALWGFSLGGWLVGLSISGSNLASHAVLTTPIIDLARAVRELSFCHPIRASLASSELDLSPLNLTRRAPRIPPHQIRVCQSQYDLFVPNNTYTQLAAAWNLLSPSVCPHSHLSVLLSPRSMRASIHWLAQQFEPLTRPSLPAPSAAAARA